MKNFNEYYSTYESTEEPTIIPEDYKLVVLFYNNLLNEDLQNEDLLNESTFIDDLNISDNPTINMRFTPSNLEVKYLKNNIKGNKKEAINFFIDKGLTENLARGIVGNLQQESGFKLDIESRDGHKSYGLAQWTGNRKLQLFSKYGSNPSFELQLEFIWEELQTTEKRTLQALLKTNSIEDATSVFMKMYERPAAYAANYLARLKFAKS